MIGSVNRDKRLVRKRLLSIATLAITVLMMVWVISTVGVAELVAEIRSANPLWAVLALVWGQIASMAGVFKVRGLLRAQGYRVPSFFLLKLYYVGLFFNHFLPSNVGGDVVRTYEIGKVTTDPATSLAAVFVERLTGFIVLVIFSAFALISHVVVAQNALLMLALVAVVAGLIMIVWLAADRRLLRLIERFTPAPLHKYLAKFGKFQTALHRYKDQPKALMAAFGWSLAFNSGAIVYAWLAALAFHEPISVLDMATVIPLTMIVAAIPLSFNGIGLQEWAFVLLFPMIGLPASVGLSATILIRLITFLSALVGGLFYLQMNLRREETVVA